MCLINNVERICKEIPDPHSRFLSRVLVSQVSDDFVRQLMKWTLRRTHLPDENDDDTVQLLLRWQPVNERVQCLHQVRPDFPFHRGDPHHYGHCAEEKQDENKGLNITAKITLHPHQPVHLNGHWTVTTSPSRPWVLWLSAAVVFKVSSRTLRQCYSQFNMHCCQELSEIYWLTTVVFVNSR